MHKNYERQSNENNSNWNNKGANERGEQVGQMKNTMTIIICKSSALQATKLRQNNKKKGEQ